MLYLLFGVLLLMSMLFSASETALFGIPPASRPRLAQSERPVDRVIAGLLDAPRDLLITVLLGNELTNIAISIVGASLIAQIATEATLAERTVYSELIVVPLLLLVGEITPKTIAARRAEGVARIVARPISGVRRLTTPIRFALRALTNALLRRLGGDHSEDRVVVEAEYRALVDMGARAGVVEQDEQRLIHNILDFGTLTVRDVMRPLDEVFSLPERLDIKAAIEQAAAHHHSRIPVWRDHPRNVTGVVFAKELLAIRWGVAPARPLRRLRRRIIYSLSRRPVADLLDDFRRNRSHMAVVVDEFGAAVGLCTLEDLLEELVGPITDTEGEAEAEAEAEVEAQARVEAEAAAEAAATTAAADAQGEAGDA